MMFKKNSKTGERNRSSKLVPMSDMNLTPMIDVMLVLLVIFMVTAPFLTVGVKVNLPSAQAPNITGNDVPIVVNIDKEGRVFIGDIEATEETLSDKLSAITAEKEDAKDAKIFVRGDRSLQYGQIMRVMGSISEAGFKRVILVTELPKKHERVRESKVDNINKKTRNDS